MRLDYCDRRPGFNAFFANNVLQEHKFLSSNALDLLDDEKSTMLIAELMKDPQDAKDESKAVRKDVDKQGAGGIVLVLVRKLKFGCMRNMPVSHLTRLKILSRKNLLVT